MLASILCLLPCPCPVPAASGKVAEHVCAAQVLANACMARDPSQRPSFAEAHQAIDAKLAEVQQSDAGPPPQALSPFASAPAPKVALAQ
jgi:hypothetical protein